MKTRQELIGIALGVLLAFNRQTEWSSEERQAMFRAVFKAIYSLL
jgi:hypothetical protein